MKFILLFLLALLLSGMPVLAKKHLLYVGTYTTGKADGIFVYSFNIHSGKLTDLKTPAVANNPSFLTISENKKYLYAVSEVADPEADGGWVYSFSIGKEGRLTLINQVATHGANPCHVTLSPDNKKLVASNYSGGSISLFNVLPDGSLSDLVQKVQHFGSGPFPERQTEPHAHSSRFDEKGKLLYVADLGIDEVKIYSVTSGDHPLLPDPQPPINLVKGSGPRHFELSADGNFIYIINELSSTISVLIKYGGVWKEIQSIKTTPKGFTGENWCADIHMSQDGRFVYGSNRGHNSISVFTRNKLSGKLVLIQTISVEGNWPRNFAIDPTERFVLVANERSNDITVFKIDDTTGKLTYTGIKVQSQSPVCLKFLN